MPPKTKKELELEAQRLLEEQQKKEEEERLKREEERKKYGIRVLETGLKCILTEYYIQECQKEEDPRKFTREFLENHYFEENNIKANFREIDWKSLIEFILYNLLFAKHQLSLNDLQTRVFLNIMLEVYMQDDLKFKKIENLEEIQDEKQRENILEEQLREKNNLKSKNKDFDLFKKLLLVHSQGENTKFFDSKTLQEIIGYANNTYFAHFNLFSYARKSSQTLKDSFQTVYIDFPQSIPPLIDAVEIPVQKGQEKQNELDNNADIPQENNNNNQQIQEEEEEEPLDEVALEIINQKIKETEEFLQKQLEDRQHELNERLQEFDKSKKPAGKK